MKYAFSYLDIEINFQQVKALRYTSVFAEETVVQIRKGLILQLHIPSNNPAVMSQISFRTIDFFVP